MKNIVLIGFMGAGKTTFGTWLAREKDFQFLDTDEMIEKKEQTSISNIFSDKGEEYFRNLETDLIKELIDRNTEGCVISVGGGLPVRAKNRILLKRLGRVVYLRATVDTLCERLQGDTKRPLLQGADVRKRIEALMEKRAFLYEDAANIVVDTDNLTYEDIVIKIEEQEL